MLAGFEVEEEVVVDGFSDQNNPRHSSQLLQVGNLCWDLLCVVVAEVALSNQEDVMVHFEQALRHPQCCHTYH